MGLLGLFRGKSKKNQLVSHFTTIYKMIDRKINLIKNGEVKDDIAYVESESFVINLYNEGLLKLLGSTSLNKLKREYKTIDNEKVLVSEILVKIINSDDLEYYKDDITYIHTFLGVFKNNLNSLKF